MQVNISTISPKYGYANCNNNSQRPSFSANIGNVTSEVVKESKFGTRISKGLAKHVIPKVFDNKLTDTLTDKVKSNDNLFKHFLAIGSAITSGMYMYKTITNKKLEDDRKNTLAVNQFLTFLLSTAGAYLLDGSLKSWWDKQTVKYAAKSFEDPALYKEFLEELNDAKAKNKEIKLFNKTAAAADKKDLLAVKAEGFIKKRLSNYLVDAHDKKVFMNRVKGMGYLRSMLVFALVYRYLVPVLVTKPANILCEKYLAHKQSKDQQAQEAK